MLCMCRCLGPSSGWDPEVDVVVPHVDTEELNAIWSALVHDRCAESLTSEGNKVPGSPPCMFSSVTFCQLAVMWSVLQEHPVSCHTSAAGLLHPASGLLHIYSGLLHPRFSLLYHGLVVVSLDRMTQHLLAPLVFSARPFQCPIHGQDIRMSLLFDGHLPYCSNGVMIQGFYEM